MNYISISLYRKVINHALAEGMQMEDFKNLPSPVDRIDKLQAVPADHFFGLHEQIDQILGPGFSVRVGQQMEIEDYGVLGLSWKTCSKAGEIFERSERYFMLLSNTYVFKVEKERERSKIYLFREGYRKGVALSNEATFSATVVVLKAITETDISPVEVSFKHASPGDLISYTDAFQCPVLFNQSQNYIAYKTHDLERRTAKADASINAFLVDRVEEKTKGIKVSVNKLVADIERLIKDALPSGIPSIEQLSQHLGMSSRTLTRRLSERNTSFRDLIKKTQKEISKDLLLKTSLSVGEIAFQTGFSEQSAFNRAFKRWTGQSPTEFRKIY
jgi:AraC-like DNA-binding protein